LGSTSDACQLLVGRGNDFAVNAIDVDRDIISESPSFDGELLATFDTARVSADAVNDGVGTNIPALVTSEVTVKR
jgi:hypothetical protein